VGDIVTQSFEGLADSRADGLGKVLVEALWIDA
jgi:hypothetical protein